MKIEIYLVECRNLYTDEYEIFGVFSSQGEAIRSLRDSKKETGKITPMEMDKTNSEGGSFLYINKDWKQNLYRYIKEHAHIK